jgi:hypothetical protein
LLVAAMASIAMAESDSTIFQTTIDIEMQNLAITGTNTRKKRSCSDFLFSLENVEKRIKSLHVQESTTSIIDEETEKFLRYFKEEISKTTTKTDQTEIEAATDEFFKNIFALASSSTSANASESHTGFSTYLDLNDPLNTNFPYVDRSEEFPEIIEMLKILEQTQILNEVEAIVKSIEVLPIDFEIDFNKLSKLIDAEPFEITEMDSKWMDELISNLNK